MKKVLSLMFIGLLFALVQPVLADDEPAMNQEMQGPMMKEHEMMEYHHRHHKGMMGHGMMQSGMGMMCPMMKMGEPQMVSVGDGVVILIGNKLIKYDKNLNVVKEVEIKVDMEAMKKMMMKEGCPMMGDMEGKGGSMEEEKGETMEEEKAEHEAHH